MFIFSVVSSVVFGYAYWTASEQVNWQPSETEFDGWVAVLQPSAARWNGQLNLTMALQPELFPDPTPAIAYGVAVCGTGSFRGELLIGGDARLTDPTVVDVAGGKPVRAQALRRLVVEDQDGSRRLDGNWIQRIPLEIAKPPRCLHEYTTSGSLPPFRKGGAIRITGNTQASVQYRAPEWFGHEGPRSAQLWPLVGGLPSVPPDFATEIPVKVEGLGGEWLHPAQSYFTVAAGQLESSALVANVRPELSSSRALTWRDVRPIRASAEIVDTAAMGWWERVVVGTSLLAATFISMLTSFLVDLCGPAARNSRPGPGVARPEAAPEQSAGASGRGTGYLAAHLLLLLVMLARWRRGRR